MKTICAIFAASSLALLSACDRGSDQAVRAPTQTEEISEFCNQVASDFAANPSTPTDLFMGRMQRKIIEKEWNPETVINACSEALSRKAKFIQQQTAAIQKGTQ